MSNYYYLDVTLDLPQKLDDEITPQYFKRNVLASINQLFGEVAASVDIDILKYNPETLSAVLRVPRDHYVKIRSSLTLCRFYSGTPCAYRINKASPLLLSLQGDSRNYQH